MPIHHAGSKRLCYLAAPRTRWEEDAREVIAASDFHLRLALGLGKAAATPHSVGAARRMTGRALGAILKRGDLEEP